MNRVTLSSYTDGSGRRVHAVLLGGQAHSAPSEDLATQTALARELYAGLRGAASLETWDGDTSTTAVLERKGDSGSGRKTRRKKS